MLPAELPAPADDGAAAHLYGAPLPSLTLPATDGRQVSLRDESFEERLIVYAYPRTGVPGQAPLVDDWDSIPGARGCTPQACAFRDHHAELREHGARVYGLSTQSTPYQQEAATRLRLLFPLLSDERHHLTHALNLPTFRVAGHRLLRRLTLIVRDGHIEHVFYPVFPPDTHAEEVLLWLSANRG